MTPEPPLPLNETGREFWDRHHDRLKAAGLLTAADLDTFAWLCVLWSKMAALSSTRPGPDEFRSMVQVNQLGKQFESYARQFGMFPKDRKRSKLDENAPPPTNEFGL